MKIYECIKILSKQYPLSVVCNALNVNKSSYLYWLNTGISNEKNRSLFFIQIINIYSESNGIYGAPKITAILNERNFNCSISKVSLSMNILGIRSIVSKKFPKKISRFVYY